MIGQRRALPLLSLLPITVVLFLTLQSSVNTVSSSPTPFDLDYESLLRRHLSEIDLSTVLKHGHDLRETFQSWMSERRKEYSDVAEELRRFAIWLRNHEYIEKHNSQFPAPYFKLGHNHFSDLTNDEFKKLYTMGEHSNGMLNDDISHDFPDEALEVENERHLQDLPINIDWVSEGAVTEVKNQGQCGSCWSFSTTGALEGAKFITDGELVELSEQMLIDCDKNELGCDGGTMTGAFAYAKKSGGLCAETDYPYKQKANSFCEARACSTVPDTSVKNYVIVGKKSTSLSSAVAKGPVTAGIQAYVPEFQLYSSGVFDFDGCGSEIDHAILVVGYGTDENMGIDYWKVKNSWGKEWGEDGYVRLARDSPNKLGTCGILKQCSFPIV